jgi:hypothetical protein
LLRRNWRRYLRLPKHEKKQKTNKRRASILRNGSTHSTLKLKTMQQRRLQKQRRKRQTTFALLICGIREKP